MVASVRVQVLGGFTVWRGGHALPPTVWQRRKAGALFKCLLSAPGMRLRREQAIDLLWPDSTLEAGRLALRGSLHHLRQLLDGARTDRPSVIQHAGDVLVIAVHDGRRDSPSLAPEHWLDAAAFRRAAQQARAGTDQTLCRAALDRYGGPYLPDDVTLDAEWEEPWVRRAREELRQVYLGLLLHQSTLLAATRDVAAAESWLHEALRTEPTSEEAAAQLMVLLAAQGRRSEALRTYQALAAALSLDLDTLPSADLDALRTQLLVQEAALPATSFRPRAPLTPQATNLPAPLTSFVGRVWEQQELRRLVGTTRLLTLTGVGGCGKTRLALTVAAGLVTEYPEGVWFVDLAARSDPAVVPGAVAAALGVREEAHRPLLETLCAFVAPRHLLVVLDNCEHLVDACALLAAALLRAAPDLRIMATSREALGVDGELVWATPRLTIPPAALTHPEDAAAYEAVQLFVLRARSVQPGFALGTAAAAVGEICRRLDGIPLALELAAARLTHLSVQQIAAGLDNRFGLLVGGARTALPRQQTLHATLDWSHDLLSQAERVLLRRLAVFRGGWALDAAEAVCADTPRGSQEIRDLEGGLVRKSLVIWEEGVARYRLLETVRAYAWAHAEASGEAAVLRDRHAQWCLSLAEEAEPLLLGPDQAVWLARLEREHDNLRAALGWTHERGAEQEGLRLAGALWWFWAVHGHLGEGRRWLEGALALAETATRDGTLRRAKVLHAAGSLAEHQGDYARASVHLQASLALRRKLGDRAGSAASLSNLGNVAYFQADYDRAAALYTESATVHRALGDVRGLANALNNLGAIAVEQGDYGRARALHEESLALRQQAGEHRGMADSLINLGELARRAGDLERAAALYHESLAIRQALGDTQGMANALHNLGEIARATGQQAQAAQCYAQSLTLLHALGRKGAMAEGLEEVAGLATAAGQGQQAPRLYGAAAAVREATGAVLPPSKRLAYERDVAATRVLLGDAAFDAAWAQGRAGGLDQAIAVALALTGDVLDGEAVPAGEPAIGHR